MIKTLRHSLGHLQATRLASLLAVGLGLATCGHAQTSPLNFVELDAHLHKAADVALYNATSLHEAAALQANTPALLVQVQPTAQLAPDLPTALLAVPLIESGGNPLALSSKGARGLWQLMPATARRYGLTVNQQRDERLDPVRSTLAATQYLRDLHQQFGSWPLALAAYNWGEQNLAAALARTHTNNFESLLHSGVLPAETRAYVPAVLARGARFQPGIDTGLNPLNSTAASVLIVFAAASFSPAQSAPARLLQSEPSQRNFMQSNPPTGESE